MKILKCTLTLLRVLGYQTIRIYLLFFLDHYQNHTIATNAAQSEVHNLLPHTNNTTLPPDVVVGSSMSKSQFEMVIMTEKSKKASEDLIQISKAK